LYRESAWRRIWRHPRSRFDLGGESRVLRLDDSPPRALAFPRGHAVLDDRLNNPRRVAAGHPRSRLCNCGCDSRRMKTSLIALLFTAAFSLAQTQQPWRLSLPGWIYE